MSQAKQVYSYIEATGSITQAEAWEHFQCWRLSARIKELREAGIPIVTVMKTNGKSRWAEYRIEKAAPGVQTENGNEVGTLDTNPTSKNNTTF